MTESPKSGEHSKNANTSKDASKEPEEPMLYAHVVYEPVVVGNARYVPRELHSTTASGCGPLNAPQFWQLRRHGEVSK